MTLVMFVLFVLADVCEHDSFDLLPVSKGRLYPDRLVPAAVMATAVTW